MPYSPKKPCGHPGCPELIDPKEMYCETHKPLHPAPPRETAVRRGYDARWNRMRKSFLRMHPLCAECLKRGQYVRATDVDHVIPHRGDPELLYNWNNLNSLCHSCHSKKSMTEDRWVEYKYK